MKLGKPNRVRRRNLKPGKAWCMGCDHAFIGDTRKCKVCGVRNGIRREKPRRDFR